MTTAIAQPGRTRLPMLALLGAGAAVALSVVAIATDDVGNRPAQIITPVDADQPAVVPADAPQHDSPLSPTIVRTSRGRIVFTGCDGPISRDRQMAC